MKFRAASVIFLWLLMCVSVSAADKETNSTKWYAFKGDQTKIYRVQIPKLVKTGSTYPMVVLLHGLDSKANSILKQWGTLDGMDNYYILAPQAPPKKRFNKMISSWKKNEDGIYLQELILLVSKKFQVDSKKIYLVGYSAGAPMAMHLVNANPKMFGKLALVGGGKLAQGDSTEGFSGLKIYMLGAQKDPLFNRNQIQIMSQLFKNAGATVKWEIARGETNAGLVDRSRRVVEWINSN